MVVPHIAYETFSHAPLARSVMFHRTPEGHWRPEVEVCMVDWETSVRIPPPSDEMMTKAFDMLPDQWVGSMHFVWLEQEARWQVKLPVRARDNIGKVCEAWA